MKCQRFQKLIRNWYAQVQSESMAPARMVFFMERHIGECEVCITDPGVKEMVKKITTFVMPSAKDDGPILIKASDQRVVPGQEKQAAAVSEPEEEDESEEVQDDDNEDDDIDEDLDIDEDELEESLSEDEDKEEEN